MNLYVKILIVLVTIVVLVIMIMLLRERHTSKLKFFKSVWAARDKETVLDILGKSMGILRSHGIEMVAIFGTLIGVFRHGGIIPWDDDLDFVIRRGQKEALFSLKGELARVNIGLVEIGYIDGAKLYPLDRPPIDGHPWSWPFIDIFYYDEGEKNVTISYPGPKMLKSDFFPFKKGIFEGIHVNIPNNSEKILRDRYGKDWKDVCISSDWNHHLEKPQKGGNRVKCIDVI